ncbi:MAG: threonine--tRNA ligase catalytic subunit [Candidatus Micrarchaeota archaeon]|nr:MAG: threonine--tRNA ligase catalytic subunit [Candidatus Micrarchaeota archaeon]
MKALLLDVEKLSYEAVKPEAEVYEEERLINKRAEVNDALCLMFTVESGDNDAIAAEAANDAISYCKKNNIKNLVVYPYAHLSSDHADLREALRITKNIRELVKGAGLNLIAAPFGWNKKLELSIKGHPLAEQFREYGSSIKESSNKEKKELKIDTSIVRKSDWKDLPEDDHRRIGERLDLYSFQEVSPAMVYFHPRGTVIYNELTSFLRELEQDYGYEELILPAISNIALFHVSGHLDHYVDNMFIMDSPLGRLALKPMNCPSTILIYKTKRWSYRDLPWRTATFSKVYRMELSGAVTGLFRVRELTQDDGHIFAREDQVEDEISKLLEMIKKVYDTLGLKFYAKLSTRPDDYIGDESLWDRATAALENALKKNNISYQIKEKEGAFYGPKIDVDVLDSRGRYWQCATIQLDYQLPRRFGITYIDENGKEQVPVIIHRAILGSLERFIGVMTEHFKGAFPTWLSPVQVYIATINDSVADYAKEIYSRLKKERIRAALDTSDRTLEYKIREAHDEEAPYIIIVGSKEKSSNKISIRMRGNKQLSGIDIEDFISKIKKEISDRSLSSLF